jgi:hypothetical protein
MNRVMPPPDRPPPDRLEQLIDRTLRGQPLRQAPDSLQSRVLAEIERRAALPWWRKSFIHWPISARIVFLIASLGLVRIALQATGWISTPITSTSLKADLPAEVSWIQSLLTAIVSVIQHMPPTWVYGALIILAAMYAAVFGLSAAAYRTLYATR